MLLAEHILFGPVINAAKHRAKQPEMKHLRISECNNRASSSNAEVKNIKSAGFTQLVKKTLQTLQGGPKVMLPPCKINATYNG